MNERPRLFGVRRRETVCVTGLARTPPSGRVPVLALPFISTM